MPTNDSHRDSADTTRGEAPPPQDGAAAPAPAAATAPGVETLPQQADRLEALDPLDVEPAHVFAAGEWAT